MYGCLYFCTFLCQCTNNVCLVFPVHRFSMFVFYPFMKWQLREQVFIMRVCRGQEMIDSNNIVRLTNNYKVRRLHFAQ
jgi:hypothetical protein